MPVLEDDSTSGAPRTLMDQPGPQRLVVVDWAASSTQGSQRLRNEDSWGQLGPIFSVADGMGGLEAGDTASTVATRALVSSWFTPDEPSPTEVVNQTNDQVRAALAGNDAGGTTLSALRIAHDQATTVHVGDSRIYRLRDRQIELLTRDHNLRTELLSAGIVPKSTHNFGPLRSLTSYLGMATPDLHVDVRSVALRDGDVLVLCTDGVFDALGPVQFVTAVVRADTEPCEAVASTLTAAGGPDDATAVVLRIGTLDREVEAGLRGRTP